MEPGQEVWAIMAQSDRHTDFQSYNCSKHLYDLVLLALNVHGAVVESSKLVVCKDDRVLATIEILSMSYHQLLAASHMPIHQEGAAARTAFVGWHYFFFARPLIFGANVMLLVPICRTP